MGYFRLNFIKWSNSRALRLIIWTLITAGLAFLLADFFYFLPRIYPGVQLHGLDLGGKSRIQMVSSLENMAVTFTGPAKAVAIPLRELGIILDGERQFQIAYQLGRKYQRLPSYLERLRMLSDKAVIPLQYQLDLETLQQQAAALENTFRAEPEIAYFQVCPDEKQAQLVSEQPGFRLSREELILRLLNTLARPALPLTVVAPLYEVPAEITAAYLREKGITALRSSFSTEFDYTNRNRSHNIKLAASHLDGLMIAPGEIFSLNATIGDTTPEKGYREAPVIIGRELATGIGGGLCQVSSTLYNSALLADLSIIERYNHTITVPYLPPGRDASVLYGAGDFKFRNSSGHYIMLNTVVQKGRLTCRIFGAPLNKRVEIITNELARWPPPVRYEFDPELAPGSEEIDEGSPGFIVEVWKIVYQNGEELSRKRISEDQYSPYPTVIRRGE